MLEVYSRGIVDESKTHLFLSQFLGLIVLFNVKLWNFHQDLCFKEI